MIFAVRQVQEKARKKQRDLYIVFVDLTKAFDSVNRRGLWKLLRRLACPAKLVNIAKEFHEGMKARVVGSGAESVPFDAKNGVKQGRALTPALFGVVIAATVHDALLDCETGIDVRFRLDGNVFDLSRLPPNAAHFESWSKKFSTSMIVPW